jgi:hypothetical protein
MKAHSRIRKALLALALSGCLSALALPATAGARPIIWQPVSQQTSAPQAPVPTMYHLHGRPALYAVGAHGLNVPGTDNGSGGSAYKLPAGFATDTQTTAPASSTQTPSVVVREVHNAPSDNDHTLAIVLASAALAIALCGTAYAMIRTSRIQRRVLGSNS